MKKIAFTLAAAAAFMVGSAFAPAGEKLRTQTGHVWFFSDATLEDITAHNYQVGALLDKTTGDMAYSMDIDGFEFEKSKMQEHFRENYMESTKYPKATFKGKVTDLKAVNFSKDGVYNVNTKGNLTIHGVTKEVSAPGTLTVKGKDVTAKSKFNIALKDYNITIPSTVAGKIAESIEVNVDVTFK